MKKYDLIQTPSLTTTAIISDCIEQLKKQGSVILVPTETVYGLVCDWQDETAIKRIYNLKQRDYGKPLALFADCLPTLEAQGIIIPENAKKIAAKFCPGPVTIIIPGANGQTIGFRIPDHPWSSPRFHQCKQFRHA
jgi:L-threonylcarbamoyladenylate synthase